MTITTEEIQRIVGSGGNVVSASGEKIGGIGQIYVDDVRGEPTWVTAKTGLFGTSESFVPLHGADVVGEDIRVNYDKDIVKDAPRVDPDGSIGGEEEQSLYAHYGLGASDSGSPSDADYPAYH